MGLCGYYYYIDEPGMREIKAGDESVFTMPMLLSLDEYWEVIHYIFCKKTRNGPSPWGYIVPLRIENEIRDALATVYFIYPEQVRMAKEALFSITEEEFVAMYDFKQLKKSGLYGINWRTKKDKLDKDLLLNFRALQTFFNKVSQSDDCIIFYVV
ncbi:hypothetical protein PGRAN_15492 [Listeria grandensis FSL F6-0971]|uniref:DUF1877 family protein n=1 Tax=Listeria grandensis FSL F6-0971 TaxID=1265819 RepID=W7ATQ0_9LIST|nr:DUF1877 family protein [Listeria grandensis]EUJ18484.1 hypothetical protein PGRAN_15492 [Listeria grandensis FSL F6-0971]